MPEGFVFHGLRHTALTAIGRTGATMAELKLWAGHADDATVQRYQHATADRTAAQAAQLASEYLRGVRWGYFRGDGRGAASELEGDDRECDEKLESFSVLIAVEVLDQTTFGPSGWG